MDPQRDDELIESVRKHGIYFAYGWLDGAVEDFLNGTNTKTQLRARYNEITAAREAARATP